MIRIELGLVLGWLWMTQPALAEEEAPAEVLKTPRRRTSEVVRSEKTTAVFLEPIGINYISGMPYPVNSLGARGQFLFDESLGVDVALSGAQGSYHGDGAEIFQLAGQFRYFIGNSFYANFGVGLRRYRYQGFTGSVVQGTHDRSSTFQFSETSAGPLFDLGNQWQFSYFSLGCSWMQVYLPWAHGAIMDETESRSTIDDAKRNSRESDFNLRRRALAMNFVRLYVGAAF